jgi:alcohol dehydrogenase class IV/acyl carrier protein
MENVKSKVLNILCELFSVSENDISDNTGPGDLTRWDSIGQLRLVLELEKQFNIQLSVDDVMSINKVADIVTVLKKYVEGSEAIVAKTGSGPAIDSSSFHPVRFPSQTYWGQNSIASLQNIPLTRVALVTGSSVYSERIVSMVTSMLSDDVKFKVLHRPSGEPKEQDIIMLSKELGQFAPDQIVAIGGGSTIDFAKLSWLLVESRNNNLNEISNVPVSINQRGQKLFIAIPTAFGSGSEVSSSAAYTKKGELAKSIIISHDFIPDHVILDPLVGGDLSNEMIWAGAVDALTHSIEGFVSLVSHPMIERIAIQTISSLIKTMNEFSLEGATPDVLESFCYSSYYGGIVQNHCSVGLTHSFAHQLSEMGIGHGKANAIFLLPVMEYNSTQSQIYESLSNKLGYESISAFIDQLKEILNHTNLLSLNEDIIEMLQDNQSVIIDGAMQDITYRTNPVSLDVRAMSSVFEQAVGS